MRRVALVRDILSIAVAALIAGCGGSQPPIGAPGAIPQSRAVGARINSSNYKVVYSFSGTPDGSSPVAALIDAGGTFYGTTEFGGNCKYSLYCGTVFSITPSGTENVLHTFGAGSDGIAGLIDVSGTFYATTSGGGSYTGEGACTGSGYVPCGTVFSIAPSGTETVVHSFGKGSDGLDPAASLINVNSRLYGTTQLGGTHKNKCNEGCGTVFSIAPSGEETVLHSFEGVNDGGVPAASLIEVKRALYGTTYQGGAYQGGTVFRITLNGREKVLHTFGIGADGRNPVAALINVNGTLYGTTESGGAYQDGTVFSITLGGSEKVLHSFVGGATDGAVPVASLIEVKGKLYGTTESGGPYSCHTDVSCGTVFSITPSGAFKLLHSFGSGTDGRHPAAALIDVGGTLYGTTAGGGTHQHGTVFAFKP